MTTQTRQNGPPPLIPAIVMAVLTATAAALGATAARFDSTNLLAYDQTHHTGQLVLGTLVFGTAVPLLIWSATVYRRLHRLGVTAPGTAIAYGGGILAAASLALSGLLTWTTAQLDGSTDLLRARFGGLVRLIIVSITLPTTRHPIQKGQTTITASTRSN